MISLLRGRRHGMTDAVYIGEVLDQLYPNAQSKTVIEYEGKKYQIRYFISFVLGYKHWAHNWTLVEDK